MHSGFDDLIIMRIIYIYRYILMNKISPHLLLSFLFYIAFLEPSLWCTHTWLVFSVINGHESDGTDLLTRYKCGSLQAVSMSLISRLQETDTDLDYRVIPQSLHGTPSPSQYPKRRLSVRSRKVSKPRDRYFKLSYRFEIWQAHRQHCCRSACQISERSDNSKYKSRGFETLRDLMERRLFGYWDGAQIPSQIGSKCCD